MTSEVSQSKVHEVLERHQARYEVRPYYAVFDQRPVGSPAQQQRIQAGFDVDLLGVLEKMQWPHLDKEDAHTIGDYFETVAKNVQSEVGRQCTIEIIVHAESLSLDAREHFQPEAILQFQIRHCRGLDQPGGPPEEQALNAIREALRELGVKQA